ncbi:hypothetical protein N9Z02_02795 [Akkermansiaceae bacterium]|nr:hypothetical protein [Akkermansiaceae bacterium]
MKGLEVKVRSVTLLGVEGDFESDQKQEEPPECRGSIFPQTRWSMVIAAGSESEETRQALAELCESYWLPIYCYLRRSHSEADSKDFTQGFFEGLLRRDDFSKLTEAKGRFRNFLLASLKNYLLNQHRNAGAQKRSSGEPVLSFDHEAGEALINETGDSAQSPDHLFDVRWARTILNRSLGRVRKFYERKRKEEIYDELLPMLVPNAREFSYEEIAANLGCSAGAARKAAFDLRQKLKECFRAEVFETLTDPEEIDEEISYLITLIGETFPIFRTE